MNIKLDAQPHFGLEGKIKEDGVELGIVTSKIDGQTLDSAGQAFFIEQMELILPKVIEARNSALRSREFIPVNTTGDLGTELISYYEYSKVGYAKFIADMANDIPRVDLYGEKRTNAIKPIASSYGYNIFEIARAGRAGINLESKRAEMSADANRRKIDYVAWFGAPKHGLQGFINNNRTSRYIIPNGVAGTATWATKTADEILEDMYGIVDAQDTATFDNMPVNTIIMPMAQYNLINQTRISDNLETTVMEQFQKARPNVSIYGLRNLSGVGEAGGDVLIAYSRNPETLDQRIPVELQTQPQGKQGLEYVTTNVSTTGGTVVYYPQAVTQAEGI